MSVRGLALLVILVLALGGLACSNPAHQVVDQYFRAINAKDSQTVSGFALVGFDKKADKWSVDSTEPEVRTPAKLPDLDKKVQDAEAAVAANTKAARGYSMDHVDDVDKIREIQKKKGGKIPPNLTKVADEWDKFTQKDRELKKAVAEAREAQQKEKTAVTLSLVERNDDLAGLTGDQLDVRVNLSLTVGGQSKPYGMTLRKYEMHDAGKPNRMSRWIVAALEPKG